MAIIIEFIIFGILGAIVGLRFAPVRAAMLSIFVIGAIVFVAIALNASLQWQVLAAVVSLVAFNIGLFWGLLKKRGKAGPNAGRTSSFPVSRADRASGQNNPSQPDGAFGHAADDRSDASAHDVAEKTNRDRP